MEDLSQSMQRDLIGQQANTGLERLCSPAATARIVHDLPQPGLERMEAALSGDIYAPHRHDTYALGLTLRGVQSFRYRGERRVSLPGQIIILHPDEVHDGAAGDERGLGYRMLYLEPSRLWPALAAPRLPFVRDPVVTHPALRRLLQSMLSSIGSRVDDLEADEFVALLAPLLGDLSHEPGRSARRLPVQELNRVRDFLVDHAQDNIGSPHLEALAGLDRFALARGFRAQFGTTPHRFLIMRRLERARALIGAGSGLAEAAATTGFADQAHLTRHFKKAYGVTPGKWAELTRPSGH